MNRLVSELAQVLPQNMHIPHEICMLYDWIEQNNFYVDRADLRIGLLYPETALYENCNENERNGGTKIQFYAEGTQNLKYWFGGEERPEINSRLCTFARSGAEGSTCAFWLSEQNELKIVHMGSGSGSVLTCILAHNVIDFLRLLAIGYDEICWDEEFNDPPNHHTEHIVFPNLKFQDWVKSTFQVEIPNTASEIVEHITSMDDATSEDEFFNWCQKMTQYS